MSNPTKTPLYDRHLDQGANIVEFGGWEMPLHYSSGIVREHLAARKTAGLFDVSHMGRFTIKGRSATRFLQHTLTNNAEALNPADIGAQYTILANDTGGAIDDAFLYRFDEEGYLLVVNAANRGKDWAHLTRVSEDFEDVDLSDATEELAMLALQGPEARAILKQVLDDESMPEPLRNAVTSTTHAGTPIRIARTGYTGEPLCFELIMPQGAAPDIWDRLTTGGATPAGLGARDTLRLEAGMPLYGHELGLDHDGVEIPILAVPVSRPAVSFSPLKDGFIGRQALHRQFAALKGIIERDLSHLADLPRMVRPVAITGRGIARPGTAVRCDGKGVGWVTSGTMVPYWVFSDTGLTERPMKEHRLRSICLAYIDSDLLDDTPVTVEIRGKSVEGMVVSCHLRSDAPPYARPIVWDHAIQAEPPASTTRGKVRRLLEDSLSNTRWRRQSCINLIPSEMTASPMVRLLSVLDPSGRYAEHRQLEAFYDMDVFYYQGTDFIAKVEKQLEEEMCEFLGCEAVELRHISGQMANTAVFSAMVDFVNRADRKREPRRIKRVLNHHIGKGGHLSSQPMGALRDFVARDPQTERPAVTHFPVLNDNPYRTDVDRTLELIEQYEPELIVFGKSMVLHREPIAEIRHHLDSQGIQAVIMYDMAHVLGLLGPHFQHPFAEGVDLVTGSTHKTFFGTQRGLAAGRYTENDAEYDLWEALKRRTFPGSVSNHHLGTLLGLLMAAFEMNAFKGDYQPAVIANGKAFARALHDAGLDVAGDPAVDYTETHQVILRVGYGQGAEIARRLERNHIICNFQAAPDEEGFTASGSLRLGVAEMTRFGMGPEDLGELADLIGDAVLNSADVGEKIKSLRQRFQQMQYCFAAEDYGNCIEQLHQCL